MESRHKPTTITFPYLHTSRVEGLVPVLLLEHGHHLPRVQHPPVQQEGGVGGRGVLGGPPDLPGFGVKRVAPWLGLPQEMDHFGVTSVSEEKPMLIKPCSSTVPF